jgi:hypothetical protein
VIRWPRRFFKEIVGAYEILSDAESRAAFDRDSATPFDDSASGPSPHPAESAFVAALHRAADYGSLKEADNVPSTALRMLINCVVLLFLVIVLISSSGHFVRVLSWRMLVIIAVLIFGIFKYGMDWVEERAWRRD